MGLEPLQLDADAVRGIGEQVTQAATVLGEAVPAAGSGLAPPARAGSTAATAAGSAETAWLAELRRLSVRTAAFGTGLTEAAREYEAADRAGGDDLRRSGLRGPR